MVAFDEPPLEDAAAGELDPVDELLPHPVANSPSKTLPASMAKRARRRATCRRAIFMGDLNPMVKSTVSVPHPARTANHNIVLSLILIIIRKATSLGRPSSRREEWPRARACQTQGDGIA